MPDTPTPILGLILQTIGGNENDWGRINNENFERTERAIAGSITKAIVAGANSLTADEARAAMLVLTGTPSSDATLVVPTATKFFAVRNNCGGAANVLVKTTSGLGIIPPRGQTTFVLCDGTDVDFMRSGGDVPVGGMIPNIGGVTNGWGNYLPALGQPVSRTTYARLFAELSTRWGAGDGSTTFNLPLSDDRYVRGGQANEVGVTLAASVGPHAHAFSTGLAGGHGHTITTFITDPGHSHPHPQAAQSINVPAGVNATVAQAAPGNTGVSQTGITAASGATPVADHAHGGSTDNGPGSENRPASLTALWMVRFQ